MTEISAIQRGEAGTVRARSSRSRKHSAIFILLLFAAVPADSAQIPQRPHDQMQAAYVLASQHKYREAAAAIRGEPPPADRSLRIRYFRLLGAIHSGLGERTQAADAMEKALALAPEDEALAHATALAEADAGRWSAYIRRAAPAFAKRPDPADGLLLLQARLALHAPYASTLAKLDLLNMSEDERLQVRSRAGELLASAEKHHDAALEFEKALAISTTDNETLLYNAAVEEFAIGDGNKALDHLQRARQQRDSAEIEDLAADIEERNGDPAAALQSHEAAISLAPDDETYRLSLGAALLRYRDYAKATEVFESASQAFPHSSRIYAGLGMADYLSEKYDASATALLRATELEVGSEHALGYLGATQMDTDGEPRPEVLDTVCGRADSHPKDPVPLTWCGALQFRQSYLSGNLITARAAIQRLQQALVLAPNDAVATCVLGRAFLLVGSFAEARHRLETCVHLRPDSSQDHYALSRVYSALGMKQAAAAEAMQTAKLSDDQRKDALARQFAADVLPAARGGQRK